MPGRPSPTVRRRRLAIELRRLREAARLTVEQVAGALECSHSKISRIETAQVGVTPRDVRDMLELYGVQDERRDELIQIAREARQNSWWRAYRDSQAAQTAYADMEIAAASILDYEPLVVPGLLQTEAYARRVIRAVYPEVPLEAIDDRVELRLARQSILTEDDPPSLWAVLHEAALRQLVGGREVMREQLNHLYEQVQMPNVTFQVMPFDVGEHAGMDGAFTILRFPEAADPDVVYIEQLTGQLYLERPEEIRRYSLVFDHLRAAALAPEVSIGFLADVAKEL